MKLLKTILLLMVSIESTAQFEVVPTGTTSSIEDMAMHGDTLIISGKFSYFAKSYDFGETTVPFAVPGSVGYANFDFQVVQDKYYILSVEGMPYEHNYVLRSADFGETWVVLYDTIGLFSTMTMLDTTFGVMGGTVGAFAMTNGGDGFWSLQDSLFSTILATESYGDSTMIMMADGSFAYVTNDRGETWSWNSGPANLHEEIQFLDEDTIYSIAHSGTSEPKSDFYFSFNGGESWSNVFIGMNDSGSGYDYYSRVFDLYFDSPQHGIVLGYNYDIDQAMILETYDYGITWVMNPLGINEELYDFLNVNDTLAFLGGENGLVLKWDKTTLGTSEEASVESGAILKPNPTNSHFILEIDDPQLLNSEVVILSIDGREIYRELFGDQLSRQIDVSGFQDGAYLIVLEGEKRVLMRRLIVSK